ncbi:Uncharacterized protein APZ42_008641 [Daphnia magna]|uniref:Uncharacterized protein n=1 Tax=Daphnia magna TaxID=35525 RepID=A0A0P5TGN2_9CRUS|nr:Uncharacterized protein APZ42_008641 [Daphnia magna]
MMVSRSTEVLDFKPKHVLQPACWFRNLLMGCSTEASAPDHSWDVNGSLVFYDLEQSLS